MEIILTSFFAIPSRGIGQGLIIIIITVFIYIIKTTDPVFSLFFVVSCFDRYAFERKTSYALLTNLKYSSDWFVDFVVEAGRCLSGSRFTINGILLHDASSKLYFCEGTRKKRNGTITSPFGPIINLTNVKMVQ